VKKPGPRYEEIINVAKELFQKNSFHGTSIQEISDAVGLYKGSLYHYISGKQELLFHIINQAVSNSIILLSKIQNENLAPSEKLRRAIHHHVQYTAEHQSELAILLENSKHLSGKYQRRINSELERYENIFKSIVIQGIQKGEFEDINPLVATFGILGMCNWVYRWFSWKGAMTPEQIASFFADTILKGLQKREIHPPRLN
jgi:AcrR family transcriptional regulator